jgi:hypothetical protein
MLEPEKKLRMKSEELRTEPPDSTVPLRETPEQSSISRPFFILNRTEGSPSFFIRHFSPHHAIKKWEKPVMKEFIRGFSRPLLEVQKNTSYTSTFLTYEPAFAAQFTVTV